MLKNLLLSLALVLFASFPKAQTGQRVYDLAGKLTPAVHDELEKRIAELDSKTTAELAVVTVRSLDGLTVEEYANGLFNAWGIGKKDVNNGVLFLIAPEERRARIEVGYGLEPLIDDGLAGELLDSHAIPQFKEGNYEAGIAATAKAIIELLEKYPDAARGVPGSAPSFVMTPLRNTRTLIFVSFAAIIAFFVVGRLFKRRENYSTMMFMLGNIAVIGLAALAFYYFRKLGSAEQPLGLFAGNMGTGLMALFYNWRAYSRYGPHGCSKCGTKLILMAEAKDDEKLSEVQKLEEQLGSVDYDVWFCPSCLHSETERYVKTFSGFNACPKCANQTYKEERKVLTHATTSSTGLAQVNGTCASCKHSLSRQEIIPRITRSSSSSGGSSGGGSFGGGSSGGGGASRSW